MGVVDLGSHNRSANRGNGEFDNGFNGSRNFKFFIGDTGIYF